MAISRNWVRAVGVTLGIVSFVSAGAASGRAGQSAASAAKRTVIDGVYTVEQAKRGRDSYRKRCVLCHLDNGQGQQAVPEIPGQSLEREGDAEAPPLAGEAFLRTWNGRTVRELFEKTSTMPVGSPGALKPQEYADLVALIFEFNNFPAGSQELPAAREQLELITIGK
jgi:S-disulfanyl-L-cysteine oxidoreductase SoxD